MRVSDQKLFFFSKNRKTIFHMDADCLCAVVTMSSEQDQQDLNDKECEYFGD